MKVWNDLDALPDDDRPVVATVGNYDGVHLGHQAILRSTVRAARAAGARSLLVTFEPHPAVVVAPERRPRLLQTRRQKLDRLEAAGLEEVLIVAFDRRLAELPAEGFFTDLLLPRLSVQSVQVGANFRFGYRRSGDVELLARLGQRNGFAVEGVAPVRCDGVVVSSSAIREAVDRGAIEQAARMLGRPFSVSGAVRRGDGRGRELSFPTANLEVENEIIPLRGVYVTETLVLATRQASVSNVGVRPTFDGQHMTVESHLIDFEGDLYGERVEVFFLARLRDERRFSTPDELADQIARDRAAAAAYFHNQQLATR